MIIIDLMGIYFSKYLISTILSKICLKMQIESGRDKALPLRVGENIKFYKICLLRPKRYFQILHEPLKDESQGFCSEKNNGQ